MARRKGAGAAALQERSIYFAGQKYLKNFLQETIYFVGYIECDGLILCLIVFPKGIWLRLVSGGRGWILNLHPCKATPG